MANSHVSRAYIPEPRPVRSAVEITALYYPGTEQMPEWDMVDQTRPEIKPLLGWYDEGNPEVIDWQIKWAVEHGITSFCVDWYWNMGHRRLEHWVKGYYKARFRKYLKWYMMYANHNQPGAHSAEDQAAVTKYWIDNYFKTPEYYTIDGMPVVCYWDADNLDRDFIAEAAAKGETLVKGEGIRRAFAISEKMARDAGLPGIHWQFVWRGTSYDPAVAVARRGEGFSSSISYGIVWEARTLAPVAAAKEEGLTFGMVAEAMPKLWQAKAVQREMPWWLPIPTGWDDRPRSFGHATVIRDRTPETFAAICREAREFCDKNGVRHVLIHPINEWQEGSYVEPNEEYGFAMYDAIRDAFCRKPAKGWPADIRPSDVGQGPYDYPPLFRSAVQRWNFANSTEGWYRQPYGAAELLLEDGCLVFLVTRRRNFNIRQRIVPFEASKYRSFRVRMKIEPNAAAESNPTDVTELRLKWGTEDCPVIGRGIVVDDTRRVAACPVWIDGMFHEYALDLSTNPDWKGKIDELWFEACSVPHARVSIDWMRFDERAPKATELNYQNYRGLYVQPRFRLVALFEETVDYDRFFKMPFHELSLCEGNDSRNPSWYELTETGERFFPEPGGVYFNAAFTPVHIRRMRANRLICIHFRYELFPGVDVLSGLHGFFRVPDEGGILARKIKALFADPVPLRRFALAESAVLETVARFWPEKTAVDLLRLAPYEEALQSLSDTLDAKTSVRDLAARMGLPETRFPRVFRSLFGMAPKEWLEQALFDRAHRLLGDPRRSVKEVAYALEFSTEFNFSRFIKRRCGVSPAKLRAEFHWDDPSRPVRK